MAIDRWYHIAEKARWRCFADMRRTFNGTDQFQKGDKIYFIFNVGGNNIRVIAGFNYQTQTMFIKAVLTHSDYSKETWKNTL
ncbi:MAG: type II toxin-antitoxin system HigB family toxin [Sedimentisphaerales bacterium]|nr:type II toxin-antitoxin system HigB family toxin [Sedimentisphaerales bacterium]